MARYRKDVHNEQKTKNKVTNGPQQGVGIRCPKCSGKTRVARGTPMPDKSVHGRYRVCDDCGWRIYTEERIVIHDVDASIAQRREERQAVKRPKKKKK